MKKLYLVFIIICMLAILASCTEKKDPSNSASIAPSGLPSSSHEMVPSENLPSASMDLVPSMEIDPSASIEQPGTQGLTNE